MKNKRRIRKKFIFAGVAVLLIAGILSLDLAKNVSVAEARQNVFTKIVPYQGSGLKVLEITPTVDDKELGYFFPTGASGDADRQVVNVTYGTKFNSELSVSMSPEEIEAEAERRAHQKVQEELDSWAGPGVALGWYNPDQRYAEYLPQCRQDVQNELMAQLDPYLAATLRSYGMIKPSGSDLVVGTNSEYPIYDREGKGIFGSIAGTNDYVSVDIPAGNMVSGHYVPNDGNTGSYQLADGYCIGTGKENFDGDAVGPDGSPIVNLDVNYIYKKTLYENADTSVSGNDSGQVSGNTTEEIEVYQYERIPYEGGIPEGVTFVGKEGNLDFTFLPNHRDIYYGYTVDKIVYLSQNRYYRVGNWIKEYILGDAELGCQVTYTHRTLGELTEADIQNADLIYLSGTADEYKAIGLDMSSALVKEIYNQSAIYHKAVIMDSTIYSGGADGFTNLDKLALLLWQDDQKLVSSWDSCSSYFMEKPAEPGTNPADATEAEKEYLIDNIDGLLGTNDVFTALQTTMVTGYNGTFAINNIYVYNHHFSDFQSSKLASFQKNALDNIANGDLNSMFTDTAANVGFQSVLAYIKLNNEKITTGKMSEGYVTPAIAIQYILCYEGEELALTKTAYRVLEIQPTKQFKFNSGMQTKDYTLETEEVKNSRSAFIKTCLNEDIVTAGNQDLVTFESVTIDTFNTMQTDVLTSYDVIYIGALHTQYYEHARGLAASIEPGENGFSYNSNASIPVYNDHAMDGNVYFNYGDCLTNDKKQAYSSRDLTEAKLIQLKDYLQKNGLIIVDGDLMKSTVKGNAIINPTKTAESGTSADSIFDHGRMENSSNMYELVAFARGTVSGNQIGYYSNLVSESDLENGIIKKADLTSYLNRERLSMIFITKPSQYSYTENINGQMSNVSYQTVNRTDGKYYLDFEFIINNTAAAVDAAEIYEVHFYQDLNADGRFDNTEEKHDYSVTLAADGTLAVNGKDADGVTHYSLNGGVSYKLRRQVPSDEGGIIDWCLKVEKVNNRDIYCTETGYTAIKPREKKYINILQIASSNDIRLEDLKTADMLYQYLHGLAVEDQYEITIRTVDVGQFQADTMNYYGKYHENFVSDEAMWQEYFGNFERTADDNAGYTDAQINKDKDSPMAVNMLILGFGSDYSQFTVNHPVNAIKSYIETNRPVLTGYNVVAPNIDVTASNKTQNSGFLRYFGQDRYGYTNPVYNYEGINDNNFHNRTEMSAYTTYIAPREKGNNAVAYMHASARKNVHLIPIGHTNTYWSRLRTEANMLLGYHSFINVGSVKSLHNSSDPTANASNTYVDKMNDGQIAHYPYVLGENILLSKSQADYFQLDLDSDSDGDGNSDIVVWYTLGDMANGQGTVLNDANIYSATPGDGINNYYVYNNGNVTYSGFCQQSLSQVTSGEAKLFVNTLIAAYEAGLINPTVSFYETDDSNASMLEGIAVPYDVNVTGNNAIDSSIQMNQNGTDYLYKFVNPNVDPAAIPNGTKAYFKVQDSNLVKGDKICKVNFFLGVKDSDIHIVKVENKPDRHVYRWPDGTESDIIYIQLSDNTVVPVVRIPIVIHRADFGTSVGTSDGNAETNPNLEVGTMYGFYVPMSYLNNKGSAEIYIKADTSYRVLSGSGSSTGQYVDRPLGTAYDMFTIIKQDLLKLD